MRTRIALAGCLALLLGLGTLPSFAANPVTGDDAKAPPGDGTRHPVPTLGPQPQVTILLRYADIPDTSHPTSHFETLMMSSEFPGLNHFLDEISYGNADVDGSQVVGWITLPRDWDYYNRPWGEYPYPRLDITRVLVDVVPMVDADVYFPAFDNVVLMFNAEHGCGDVPPEDCLPWAGTVAHAIAADGVTRDYGIQFFGPFWYGQQAAIAHEMMHSFGVHHSAPLGPPPCPPSHWDVTTGSGTCIPPDPDFGCLAVYTNSWHMLELGWMPPSRCFNPGASGAGIVTIERLALPPHAAGTYGMAELVSNGLPNLSYTVELRMPVGWDAAGPIPGPAVVLHRVDVSLNDLVTEVVDPDGDCDPNDASAMWVPGETYLNTDDRIVVHVENWTVENAVVAVSNQPRAATFVQGSAVGYQDGSSDYPWNTVAEGYASVYPSGLVAIHGGTYNEPLTLTKPCTLAAYAGTGMVVIRQ